MGAGHVVSVCLAGCFLAPGIATGPAGRPPGPGAPRINAVLGVQESRVVFPEVRAVASGGLSVQVPLGGATLTLDLAPHSVRSAGYRLLVQAGDGTIRSEPPGPVRTFRGEVRGAPGSSVAASLAHGWLCARICLDDGCSWLEPLADRVEGAAAGAHLLYPAEDVVRPDGACATADRGRDVPVPQASRAAAGAPCKSGIHVAELACDADYEYFLDYGSVEAVEDRINAVVNAVNVQYERDVGIRHELTAIVVRTAEPDPYPDSSVLNDFQLEWMTNQAEIPRDVAHLFSGKSAGIGVAWTIGGICEFTEHYAVAWSDCCGGFGCATDITAHELGHLWGAHHCPCSDPPSTMNSGLTCSNWFHPAYSVPEIVSYRDSVTCLGCAPDPCPADVNDDAAVNVVDLIILLGNWGFNPGHPADIDGDGAVGINDFLDLLQAWGPCP